MTKSNRDSADAQRPGTAPRRDTGRLRPSDVMPLQIRILREFMGGMSTEELRVHGEVAPSHSSVAMVARMLLNERGNGAGAGGQS